MEKTLRKDYSDKAKENAQKIEELKKKYGSLNRSLVGVDGNAFAIMAHFRSIAKSKGWEKEDIDTVLEIAKSSDYDNLVATIMNFTE